MMKIKLGLRERILTILLGIVMMPVIGGGLLVWYTYKIDSLFQKMIETDIRALDTAVELEITLTKQKGLVSYYFITGNTDRLNQLDQCRKDFVDKLEEAKTMTGTEVEKDILKNIEKEYVQYISSKDKVIELYKSGEVETGSILHEKVRTHFDKILGLCSEYKNFHRESIILSGEKSHEQAGEYRLVAMAVIFLSVVLGLILASFLVYGILDPIKRLAFATSNGSADESSGDEVHELSSHVHGLIKDVDNTRVELEKRREQLIQSEKMAVLGKLAADIAHSIRNPLTSIKMRLFSLERNLKLTAQQKEDLEVVSDEMHRLDNIVRNFLEFSRPHKLNVQKVDISKIIEMTLQLLEHKIKYGNIHVEYKDDLSIPLIEGDPVLLKEVFINLIVNACEAMEDKGTLTIIQDIDTDGKVCIKISDTGYGIPNHLQEMIFEPFFSTKDDGTGLGLAIAQKIIDEHNGNLSVKSIDGNGTEFIILLPV